MGRGNVARLVGAAAALAAAAAVVPGAGAAIPWETVVRGGTLGGDGDDGAYALMARTRASARGTAELLARADADRVTAVDFRRFGVVTVIRSFPSCGWSVRVRSLTRSGATLRVSYAVRPPQKGTVVCQALTRGYEVVRVPLASLRGVLVVRPVAVR
ncbi:MAG TPA: protease complex subunit PrcB family protein [Gaiellaceae bacterium]